MNKGSADGVTVGMFLSAYHSVTAKDPASGKDLVTNVPDGEIEVISVGPNSSVAKVASGKPAAPGGFAQTQERPLRRRPGKVDERRLKGSTVATA
jgi:hypothetical protein